MKRYCVFVCFIVVGLLYSNSQLNLPIRKIGDAEYYYRQVKKKETIYGISRELGISKEDIIKYNPSVAQGLQKDQWLYFPVIDFDRSKEVKKEKHFHVVEKGETIYGLSKIYGVDIADIVALNPEIKESGLKAGSTIEIPTEESKLPKGKGVPYVVKKGETLYRIALNNHLTVEDILRANPGLSPSNFQAGETILIPNSDNRNAGTTPETVFIAEKVEKGDSYFSIAQEYNVSEEKLKAANPEVDKLKKGQYISIPISSKTEEDTVFNIIDMYKDVHEVETLDLVRVALLLPFSEKDKSSKQNTLYSDFYKGFLLAVDSLSKNKARIQLDVYDISNHSSINFAMLSDLPSLNLIIASGDNDQLHQIAKFGQENNIHVVSPFIVNDDTYYNNDRFFQLNTPSSYMYSAVQNAVNNLFRDYLIVFLHDAGLEEKALVEYLQGSNVETYTVDISALKNADELKEKLPISEKILFVPTSSERKSLRKINALLSGLKKDTNQKCALMGYPEWMNLSGYRTFFHDMNTFIYSRYAIVDANDVEHLKKEFVYWYGQKPINSVPMMHILGYEIGLYFIPAIQNNNNDFNVGISPRDGIQSCFDFKRISNWGGFVNSSVYLINYKPNRTIEKMVIK